MSVPRRVDRVRDPVVELQRRRAAIVVVAVVAFVGLAFFKPWAVASGPTPAPETASGAPSSSSSPAAASEAASGAPSPAIAPASRATVPLPLVRTFTAPGDSGGTWRLVRWRGLAPTDALGLIDAVVRWRHGYVAIGGRSRVSPLSPLWSTTDGSHWIRVPRETTLWSSGDGSRWVLVSPEASTGISAGYALVGLAATASGVAAVGELVDDCGGTCPPRAAPPVVVWTSSDARRWVPHPLPVGWLPLRGGAVPLVASGPAGLLLASPGSAPRLAASADGATWRSLPVDTLPTGFTLTALAGTASGYVAAGAVAAAGRSEAATLSSPDGRRWPARATLLSTSVGATVTSLVTGRDGVIAMGVTDGAGDTLAWQSSDGHRWEALPAADPFGASACLIGACRRTPNGLLLGDGERFAVIRAGSPAVWVSTDGRRWGRVRTSGAIPDEPPVESALMPGGVLLVYLTTAWFGAAMP